MSERRKFKRVDVNVAVKGKLVDPQKKIDITGDILLKAKNLSEGGALLEWPLKWKCDTCSNCLGWVHNGDCRLKEGTEAGEEFNKSLVPEMHMTLQIIPGNDIEPLNALVKINWIGEQPEADSGKYDVGVSFVDADRQESEIKRKVLVIKKQFEGGDVRS